MTRWWWIRHGPTHQVAFTGWRDVPADLSDGAAIKRLEAQLPKGAAVVSSDLSRAIKTADAIQGERKRLPHHIALREFDFGAWDGLTFSDVAERDPEISRKFWEGDMDACPPQGESWRDLGNRVGRFVAEVNAAGQHRDIIAVAHIGVILTQYAQAAGIPPAKAIGQNIEPLSLTCLEWTQGQWNVSLINHKP